MDAPNGLSTSIPLAEAFTFWRLGEHVYILQIILKNGPTFECVLPPPEVDELRRKAEGL